MLHRPFSHYRNRGHLVLGRLWRFPISPLFRFSNVVTAVLIVLIENGLTLMHMPRLLTNAEFREQCLERVTDANVVEFFHDRYDRWGREAPLLRESTLSSICPNEGCDGTHVQFLQVVDNEPLVVRIGG
jgi:hypothetical protein